MRWRLLGSKQLNDTFTEPCGFAGNTLNAKKLRTIECSFPMANHPVKCTHCVKMVWRFDLKKHFELEHEGESCPDVGIISDAEKGILQKKKKNTKNALTKSDLDKLSDNEIKLLPLKDFWDVKNKKWKKGDAENFGKQKKRENEDPFRWSEL